MCPWISELGPPQAEHRHVLQLHLLQQDSQHARDLGVQKLLTLHGHPAVARMAQTLGYGTRLRSHGAGLEIHLLLN